MTITRRQFLYQTTAVTAGLYLPTYPGKAGESVEETDQPYTKPQAAQTTLYAVYGCKSDGYDGYELRLGSAEPELPEMSWRNFCDTYMDEGEFEEWEEFFVWCEVKLPDPDSPIATDRGSWWHQTKSPAAEASHFLSDVFYGGPRNRTRSMADRLLGHILFPEEDLNYYVIVPDDYILKLLEERLSQPDANTIIEVV